jgi:PAS domain S-box-containing protein
MLIRELLETADFFPEPMAVVSANGTIDISNVPFAEQFGLTPRSITGRRLDTLAAASAAAIEEYLRACAHSQKVVQGSLTLNGRANTVAFHARGVAYPPQSAPSASYVLLRLDPKRGQASRGTPIQQNEAFDRHEFEASLYRQSQILEVTLASIADAVIVTDVHGQVTFLNSVAAALTGWPSESARGQPLTTVFPMIHERTRTPVVDPVAKVLKGGVVVGLGNHTLLIARDGREIPIENSAAPVRLPNGELFGVVLIFRDITEQREAEHTRAWLAAIVDSSDDAIVSKRLDGTITSWNPAAVRLFEYRPEEIIGKPITTIVPPELYEEEAQVLARLRAGKRIDHFETVRLTKSGRRIEVSLTVSPVRNEDGQVVGASKIARDITKRNEAVRLLREADRRKDEFLATLAHELRNPLAPISAAAEVLQQTEHANPELRTACEIVQRQVRHMTNLVDDLLDVARISSGKIHLNREVLELETLVNAAIHAFRPTFAAKHQELTLSLHGDALYVYGDRTRLMQIFSNILQNANRYTPEGGRIRVDVRREGAHAVVSVRDSGIGVPPAMRERIFELFTQADRAHEHSAGGLGIGLAVARRLAQLHDATIEAYSEGEGRGSEFVVRFPAAETPQATPPSESLAPTSQVTLKVLVADDNEDAALSLSMLVQIMGHETQVAHDGRAAVEIAEVFRPDIALLDIAMPNLDGYEVVRAIAARPWARSTLLVALTGWGQEGDRERAKAAGFHVHLTKPVDPDVLRELLATNGGRRGERS